MTSFSCSLTSNAKESVVIAEGTALNISSITLTLKKKGKGTTVVFAKPTGKKTTTETLSTLSNQDKESNNTISVSFTSTDSPVELWIEGSGSVEIVGTVAKIAKSTKKGSVTAAPVSETTSSKKRKADSTLLEDSAPTAKSAKQEPPTFVDMNKAWKVKPQNDEGELVAKPKPVYKEKGLKCIDYVIGKGEYPKPGAPVKINYIGLLADGTVFDCRIKRKQPLVFRKGVHQVVRGLDVGMEGMKIGGAREITVPPELGYGEEGFGTIPGNQTLVFRVTLLG